MSEMVSVVIPVYNVEKYVERCLKSIINQTYKNLEIIIVNDGSTDNSGKICEKYLYDKRIKIINKDNGGLSDARNCGIKASNGKYITFIDSDDYVSLNYIKYLIETLLDNNLDIVECNFVRTNENDYQFEDYKYEVRIYDNLYYLENEIGFSIAWNKIYKKSIFRENNIEYPLGKLNEDEGTTYKLVYHSKKIGFINIDLYAYYNNAFSIMNNYSLRRLDYIELLEERINFYSTERQVKLLNITKKKYTNALLYNYYMINKYISNNNSKAISKDLFEKYKQNWIDVIKNSNMQLLSKILMVISRFFPSIYGLIIVRILHK